MASNPLFIIPKFLLHFLKEWLPPVCRKWENSFKPKVAIAKFIGKMQKKVWYYEKWVGRHASFPPRRSVKDFMLI